MGVGSPTVRSSGFALTDISGLQAWYKFNTGITTSGVTVLTWDDSSGNNRKMGNITATNRRPEFTAYDNTVIFSSDKYLELNSTYGTDTVFPNTNAFTAFMAIRFPISGNKVNPILAGSASAQSITAGNLTFATGSFYAFNGSNTNYNLTDTGDATHPFLSNQLGVFAIKREGTSLTFFKNSRSNVVETSTESDTSTTLNLDILGTTAASGTQITIAEVAVYDSGLSDANFDLVMDDIKTRVGI